MEEPRFDLIFDLIEDGELLILDVAVPGILETDIDVTMEGTRLIIRAARLDVVGVRIHGEIKRGILSREVELPWVAILLRSRYGEGILRLTLRRPEDR